MSFHPRMYSKTSGFKAVGDVRCLLLEQMVLDYWHVEGEANARGHYASMHPRFVFLLDGARLVLLRDRTSEPVECAACFVPAGVEIRSRLNRSSELRHVDVHLPLRHLKSLIGNDIPLNAPLFMEQLGDIQPLVAMIADECERKERSAGQAARLTHALLGEFFHQVDPCPSRARPGAVCLSRLEQYVRANLDNRISVEELAEVSGMSRSHFTRVFRSETQQSPYQWILGLRVDRAKALMARGYSFAQAADAAGFADQAHFNRVFKAVTGGVPSVWMKERAFGSDDLNLQDTSPP